MKLLLLQTMQNKKIDAIAAPAAVLDRGRDWASRRHIGPMFRFFDFFPARALVDPGFDQIRFGRRKLLPLGRHEFVRVFAGDLLNEETVGAFSRNDSGLSRITALKGAALAVETQTDF